jgi:hypothetical protein
LMHVGICCNKFLQPIEMRLFSNFKKIPFNKNIS